MATARMFPLCNRSKLNGRNADQMLLKEPDHHHKSWLRGPFSKYKIYSLSEIDIPLETEALIT